jgi:DUF4097 and DUF4098 domain-containing protein YvlB
MCRSIRALSIVGAVLLMVPGSGQAGTETSHAERSFVIAPGNSVLVDVSFHEVEVTIRPGTTVDVSVDLKVSTLGSKSKQIIEDLEPTFEERDGTLVVRSVRRTRFATFGYLNATGRVAVAMPPGVNLTVDASSGGVSVTGDLGSAELSCDTSSGSITIDGAARQITADASSGSITIHLDHEVERVVADASSGSIEVRGPARDLQADTSSGSITLEGLLGNALIDASSGGVKAGWITVPPRASIKVDTSSGGVDLVLPPGIELRGEVDTSSGSIRSDFNGAHQKHHLSLQGGSDAVRLNVNTSSGGVSIRQR